MKNSNYYKPAQSSVEQMIMLGLLILAILLGTLVIMRRGGEHVITVGDVTDRSTDGMADKFMIERVENTQQAQPQAEITVDN